MNSRLVRQPWRRSSSGQLPLRRPGRSGESRRLVEARSRRRRAQGRPLSQSSRQLRRNDPVRGKQAPAQTTRRRCWMSSSGNCKPPGADRAGTAMLRAWRTPCRMPVRQRQRCDEARRLPDETPLPAACSLPSEARHNEPARSQIHYSACREDHRSPPTLWQAV